LENSFKKGFRVAWKLYLKTSFYLFHSLQHPLWKGRYFRNSDLMLTINLLLLHLSKIFTKQPINQDHFSIFQKFEKQDIVDFYRIKAF